MSDGTDDDTGKKRRPRSNPDVKLRTRLTYRSWLWLQHRRETEYAPLARLVLSGGPEDIWVNKQLKPEQVVRDIDQFVATDREGVTHDHKRLAHMSLDEYAARPWSAAEIADDVTKTKTRKKRKIQQGIEKSISKMFDEREERTPQGTKVHFGSIVPVGDGPGGRRRLQNGIYQVQCEATIEDGERCRRWASVASTRCSMHGGEYLTEEEVHYILRRGTERLVSVSMMAIDTTIDVMQNSVSDVTRLKAAEMILDRTGFRAGHEVEVTDPVTREAMGGNDPASIVRDRLRKLASASSSDTSNVANEILKATDIIDGEVVQSHQLNGDHNPDGDTE